MKTLITPTALAALTTFGIALGVAGAATAQSADYPSQTLNFVIAFGPGGGNDLMSRTVVEILQRHNLYPGNISVENRDGGSGAVGFGHVRRQEGNPYFMTAISGNFISTPLIADTDWTHADFTPIALLANDAQFLVVRSDAPWQTAADFAAEAATRRVIVGGTGAAGPSLVVTSLFSERAGIELVFPA